MYLSIRVILKFYGTSTDPRKHRQEADRHARPRIIVPLRQERRNYGQAGSSFEVVRARSGPDSSNPEQEQGRSYKDNSAQQVIYDGKRNTPGTERNGDVAGNFGKARLRTVGTYRRDG